MKHSGWNPARRNRNIGTAKAGFGQNNRLVIPGSWHDIRVYWERLRDPVVVERDGFVVLVEPCAAGYVHAVTVDDAMHVLSLLPKEHTEGIRVIALRQPTRKQSILSGVWGRLAYFASFAQVEGPSIFLEARPIDDSYTLSRSMKPETAEELERLREDGHEVIGERRHWRIRTTPESVRATQLYRTLPHEVGHYVHYQREVLEASGGDYDDERRLQDLHFNRPTREKEDFAHRYAREFGKRMAQEGSLPFERLAEAASMRRLGLDPAWFGVS